MKFAILHVAVDNDIFAKLPRFCSVDHSFLYWFVYSSTCRSASKAHRICSNNLTVGHMSDIRRVQNSKAPVATVTRRRRRKWSCWQPGVVTWQRPCSREVFHMDIEVPPCVVRNRKIAKYVHGLKNMYPAHIFCKFCRNM